MNPLVDKYNITKSSWVMVEADQTENVNETFCQSYTTRFQHEQNESPQLSISLDTVWPRNEKNTA